MKIVVTPRGFAKYGLHNVEIIQDEGFIVPDKLDILFSC